MEYVGVLGGIITTSGGIPQLYKIYTTKSAKDLSFVMIGMWITGLTMTLSYGIYTRQFAVYVPATCSLTMSSLMMMSKLYYREPESYKEFLCQP
jgi:MtN3 and saliva related transmembrane protein